MQLYCPSCQAPFAATDRCPRCGDRLLTPAESFTALPHKALPPAEVIRPTTSGRIAVGCGIAIGLFIGLREIGLAAVPDLGWWLTPAGVALTIALRAVGVAAGGLLAGSGRPSGTSTGAAVGLICGGAYLLADGVPAGPVLLTDAIVWAALTFLGMLAGGTGSWLWPAPTELPDPEPSRASSTLASLVSQDIVLKNARPIVWSRLALGLTLVVLTVVGADALRETLRKGSGGLLNMGGPAHAPLVDLQLATVGLILAGAVAGASTGTGLRQGVLVGALGAAAVTGLATAGVAPVLVVADGVAEVVGLPADGSAGHQGLLATACVVFVLCTVAGWFGGQLMPVLASREQLTRLPMT